MADKKKKTEGELKVTLHKDDHGKPGELVEPTDLEVVEAELRAISPTLPDLKKNNPARYKEVYKRYMWLVGERDRVKAEKQQ
jgi:hypothetical protein